MGFRRLAGDERIYGRCQRGVRFPSSGIHADLFAATNFNSRWSGRVQAGVNSISGNTSDMNNALPAELITVFTATVADLAVRGEFNFFPYA